MKCAPLIFSNSANMLRTQLLMKLEPEPGWQNMRAANLLCALSLARVESEFDTRASESFSHPPNIIFLPPISRQNETFCFDVTRKMKVISRRRGRWKCWQGKMFQATHIFLQKKKREDEKTPRDLRPCLQVAELKYTSSSRETETKQKLFFFIFFVKKEISQFHKFPSRILYFSLCNHEHFL